MRNKYGNKRCEANGHKFDSMMERRYYYSLLMREKAREVSDIEVHPMWPIVINGEHVCYVEMDFAFNDMREGRYRIVDVKGKDNPMSRLKRKLLKACHGIEVELAK